VRAGIYARVSTTDQKCEIQLDALREDVVRHGWENAGEYSDIGWSGAKASRPEFDRLMQDAGKRKFDVVLCWKLDRFGRSLLNCKAALQQLQMHGVRFIATSQNIDTDESNPASRFLLNMLIAAAEFERELIRERTLAGQQRYRQDYAAGRVGKPFSADPEKTCVPIGQRECSTAMK
jgi:DNA invertase Pin-like site-specific DNA recombinase